MSAESNKKTFSSIIHYFRTNYSPTTSGRDNIKLNGRTHTPNQFHQKFIKERDAITSFVGMVEFAEVVSGLMKSKRWNQDQTLEYMSDQVFQYLRHESKKKEELEVSSVKTGAMDLIDKAFDYTAYLPVLDINSRQRTLFNTKTGNINRQATYDSWKEWVATRGGEEKKILMQSVIPAIIKYDPFNVQEVNYTKVQEQNEVLTINAHVTPEWRLSKIENPVLPPIFLQFMEHLFPNPTCRDYVYHWLNFMLTKRNQCILFLYGEQGVGKSSLAELCTALVGLDNYVSVGPEFWESRFNGEIKYRRCVFFDENEITSENVTRIRSMTNKYIAVEDKGATLMNLENMASYIWALNPDKKALVTYDDRRYSVPIIGKENIEKAKGSEWMDDFMTLIREDKNFIANIGHWILQNGDQGRFNNTKPYITDSFYDLVDRALTLWQRNILELIESRVNSEYVLSDTYMKEALRGTGRTTLQGFLDTYRDRDGEPLGYLLQKKSVGRCLIPTAKYMPEEFKVDTESDTRFQDEEF